MTWCNVPIEIIINWNCRAHPVFAFSDLGLPRLMSFIERRAIICRREADWIAQVPKALITNQKLERAQFVTNKWRRETPKNQIVQISSCTALFKLLHFIRRRRHTIYYYWGSRYTLIRQVNRVSLSSSGQCNLNVRYVWWIAICLYDIFHYTLRSTCLI